MRAQIINGNIPMLWLDMVLNAIHNSYKSNSRCICNINKLRLTMLNDIDKKRI